MDASLDGNPTVGIELATPVTARGLYGRTREVTLIWLAPDDPSGLIEAVERHRAADDSIMAAKTVELLQA